MKEPNLEDHKRHVKASIRKIETKIKKPDFQEKLSSEGHIIAGEFLDEVRWGLNVIRNEYGVSHPECIELNEAVALIGSGCLRWATSRTRILLSSYDFKRNRALYNFEKAKIEQSYELVNVFAGMTVNPETRSIVFEVKDIINDLHKKFNRRFRLFS